MIKRYKNIQEERKIKVRAKLKRVTDRLRLSIFRSNKHIFCQIINDKKAESQVAVSDLNLKLKADSKKKPSSKKFLQASEVGRLLALKAKNKKIKKVYFDRGRYKYHGRIKALADAARAGGLEF
ncbi:50S ribosomal protein L18 [Candidatus Beckwithbacteria bacterium RBG_13_35_6]|uniref:Large ribosomal subunit protein uL18 n=1 Tax=Candidatus Beckwithbacteria bacterium RBG_13_35_6 TaxID=1797456 RepID=A0A1F5DHM0_9BACT|nr:MAG: 50S ribosomal protein L18 [Candidatus Beckwithbacteria bacterium RBG_13_35_6]